MPKLIILFLFAVCNFLPAGQKVLTADNIHIYYPEQRKQIAVITLNTIQNKLPQIRRFLGENYRPVHVYITDSQATFEQLAGSHLPYWTAAVTISPKQIIVLKSPGLINTTLRQYRETVEHEFIHLYQGFFIPLNITPAWFNEGLANYTSRPYDIQSRIILSRAIIKNRIIPLSKLVNFLEYNHLQAALAYAESSSLIEFLVVVYGERIIRDIFSDMAMTKDFSVTLQCLTDTDIDILEFRWKKYIISRYRWIFLLDIQYILWLIIPLLVIIVYFIKACRNKKIVQQWNIEDNNENEPLIE
ncbi:MAG: hypothetical protein JXR87_08150 [Candidatus Marinimicrobia bacterium]|nr:hypothetical protein [Candidatus Neomarinimicrobiota bacterium]